MTVNFKKTSAAILVLLVIGSAFFAYLDCVVMPLEPRISRKEAPSVIEQLAEVEKNEKLPRQRQPTVPKTNNPSAKPPRQPEAVPATSPPKPNGITNMPGLMPSIHTSQLGRYSFQPSNLVSRVKGSNTPGKDIRENARSIESAPSLTELVQLVKQLVALANSVTLYNAPPEVVLHRNQMYGYHKSQ